MHRHRTSTNALVRGILASCFWPIGCGTITIGPPSTLGRFWVTDEALWRTAELHGPFFQPVCLFDKDGHVRKTLAEFGAGPWPSPDGESLYFVRVGNADLPQDEKKIGTSTIEFESWELCRADRAGERVRVIELPVPHLPCAVKVSPSGKYLAVSLIPRAKGEPNSLAARALLSSPRLIGVLGVEDGSWRGFKGGVGFGWPGGFEHAWSPTEDRLAICTPVNPAAEVLVALESGVDVFRALVPDDPNAEADAKPDPAPRRILPKPEEGPSGEDDSDSFGLLFMRNLVSQSPRGVVVGLWQPGMESPDDLVHIYRPHYAGFHWMPDGRNILLFGIDAGPRILDESDEVGGGMRRLLCYRLDTLARKISTIPMPTSDAFLAIPPPRKGDRLLWLCGESVHSLYVSRSDGTEPKRIVKKFRTDFLPTWTDARTLCYLEKPTKKGVFTEEAPGPPTLVTVDVTTDAVSKSKVDDDFVKTMFSQSVKVKIRPKEPSKTRFSEPKPPI